MPAPQPSSLSPAKHLKAANFVFLEEHVTWTDDYWSEVHFSDESKFNLAGSDGHQYIQRRTEERFLSKCVKKFAEFGRGSVMVWGILSAG